MNNLAVLVSMIRRPAAVVVHSVRCYHCPFSATSHTLARPWITKEHQYSRSFTSTTATGANPPAAVVVIGDEILTGKVRDDNIHRFADFAFERGIALRRVEIVEDEVQFVGPQGYVFTSGGIGPTHDDVTFEGIAAAFGVDVTLHQQTYDAMDRFHKMKGGIEMTEARARMAMFPQSSLVHACEEMWLPLVQTGNIYTFPGIPWLLQKMLRIHAHLFAGGTPWTRKQVYTAMGEGDFAHILDAVLLQHPSVSIGSYPQTNRTAHKHFQAKITFEGPDAAEVEAAYAFVKEAVSGYDESPELLTELEERR